MRYIVKYSLDLYQDDIGIVERYCMHQFSRPFKKIHDAIALQQSLLEKAAKNKTFTYLNMGDDSRNAEYLVYGYWVEIIECSKKDAEKYNLLDEYDSYEKECPF